MKRILFILTLLFAVLMCRTPPVQAEMDYSLSDYLTNKGYIGAGNYNDPLWQLWTELDASLISSDGAASVLLTPGTAPTGEEGMIYADDSSNALMFHNGTSWLTVGLLDASTYSLDTAYNNGSTMDVDGDAVTLTVSSGDNNRVLDLVQNDSSSNPETIRITNAGSGDTLQFVSTGGKDVDGTSSSWSVTHAGVGSFVGLIVGGTDIVMENADTFNNADDDVFEFTSNDKEDFEIDLTGTDIVKFTSDSSAVTLELDTLDDVNGVGNIYFDSAASQITLAANATADDLTIQVTGAVDASLDLRSAGTGADAIKIYASAGGLDVDTVADDIHIQNAATGDGEDITVNLTGDTNSSIVLASAGNAGDAISLATSNANGDIKILSTDMIDIDAVDNITVDLSGAAADFDVDSAAGSVSLDGGEAAADAVVIIASATAGGIDVDAGTGGVDVLTTGVFSIDGAAASNVSVVSGTTDENLTLSVTGATASSLILSSAGTGTDAVDLNATAGGIDIDSALIVSIDTSGAGSDVDIDSVAGSVYIDGGEAAANAIVIDASATAGGIDIDAGTGGIAVDSDGVISIDGADDMNFTLTTSTDAEDLSIIVDGDDDASIILDSDGTAADAVKISASHASGGIDMAAGTNGFDLTVTGGDLTLQNTAAKDIVLNATQGRVLITGSENAADSILLTADGTNGEIALAAKVGGIDMDAVGGPVTIDNTGAGMDIHIDASAGEAHLIGGQAVATAIIIDAEDAAGGIDMDCGTGDFDLTATGGNITIQNTTAKDIALDATAGRVIITGTESAANAIHLYADGANGEIYLQAKIGGIDMDAASGDITIDAVGAAGDLITVTNTTGTGASATGEEDAAIQLYSVAGGVGITSGLAASDAIRIETQNAAGVLTIASAAGTGASAIDIVAAAGGITAKVADAKSLKLGNSGLDAYFEVAAHGTPATEYVNIVNTAGTAANAIAITALGGGVNVTANDGNVIKLGSEGADTYIQVAPHGTPATEIISVVNAAGTADTAITLTATAGGMTAKVADEKNLILGNALSDTYFKVTPSATPASEIISMVNSAGTADGAVAITSTGGGIDINAKSMLTLDIASGVAATADIIITNTPGTDEAAIALTASAGAITLTTGLASSGVLVNTSTYEHKIKYFPISQGVTAASEVIVGGGTGLVCTSLDAGVNEAGATEGYAALGDDEDILIFSIPLPDDFVDTGTAADFNIEFDIDEQAAEECNIDVRIFEYDAVANATAIQTDTIVAANDGTRAWKTLVTGAAGIGNENDLQAGDHLIIELTATADGDDFDIYGIRLTYRVGLQATN